MWYKLSLQAYASEIGNIEFFFEEVYAFRIRNQLCFILLGSLLRK